MKRRILPLLAAGLWGISFGFSGEGKAATHLPKELDRRWGGLDSSPQTGVQC